MDSLGFHHKTPREKYEYERWEKKWAKWIVLAWVAVVIGCMYIGSDKAGAQTPDPDPVLCHVIQLTNLEINGLPANGVKPVPGDTVTLNWTQLGNRSEPLAKWIDGSGLCTFDIAFYIHGDNQVLRPHPGSTLVAHSENNPVTIIDQGERPNGRSYQTFQVSLTIPEYDVECAEGTQIDIYKDTVGSDGTWGPGVGPIEDFDTNDDGVIDRRYSDEFRLVAASNWESETELCVPPEDTTTTSTTVESTTTTTVPTTTTDPSPTSITTTSVQSPSTTSDVTVAPTTVGTAPSSTFGSGTSGKELAHTGNNGNLIVLGIALVLGGLAITIAGYRRRIL